MLEENKAIVVDVMFTF